VLILFAKYLIAASLCSSGCQESFGIMESGVVGFLYMSNDILFVVFFIVKSRKFSLLSCSRSSVKFWMLYTFGSGIYDFNIPVSIFGRLYEGGHF